MDDINTTGEEVESRYLLTEQTEEQLRQLSEFAGLNASQGPSQNIVDVYFDTPERDLYQRGTLFRIRDKKLPDGSRIYILTFKSTRYVDGSISHAAEIEAKIGIEEASKFERATGPFDEAGRLIPSCPPIDVRPYWEMRALVGTAPLERSVIITNERDVIRFGSSECHIEMALDHARYAGKFADHRERELECEKKGVSNEVFLAFNDQLKKKFSLIPATKNKYQRAIILVDSKGY